MKKALSMLTAIIFIVITSILFAIVISLLSSSTQKTMDHYLLNQEELLAVGAIEYAVMAVGGNEVNDSTKCLKNINLSYLNTYDINISIHYIGSNIPSQCNVLDNNLTDKENNATAIIDIKVSLNPALTDKNPPVTYVRRTIQKL